jgi:hypothetical protein
VRGAHFTRTHESRPPTPTAPSRARQTCRGPSDRDSQGAAAPGLAVGVTVGRVLRPGVTRVVVEAHQHAERLARTLEDEHRDGTRRAAGPTDGSNRPGSASVTLSRGGVWWYEL